MTQYGSSITVTCVPVNFSLFSFSFQLLALVGRSISYQFSFYTIYDHLRFKNWIPENFTSMAMMIAVRPTLATRSSNMVAIITSSTAFIPAGFNSSFCPIIYSLTSSSTSSSLLSSTGVRTFLSSSFSSSSSLPFEKSLPLSSPLPSMHAVESAAAFRRLVNLRKSTNRFQPDKIVNDDIIVDILDSTLVSFFFGSGSLQDDRVALSQRLKFCCYLVITLFSF